MNKIVVFVSAGLFTLGLISVAIGLVELFKDKPVTKHQRYQEHKEKETRLIIHNRILEDSIADLEVKLRILNNCLDKERLEYLDVCNRVNGKSK
jgi:hypothetical protein